MSTWTKQKLGDLIDIYDDKRIPLSTMVRTNKKGIYPYYGASGIIDYIDEYIFDGEYLLVAEDGENLKSRNTPIAFFAKGKFWVNNHAHIIQGKNDLLNTHFLNYWFSKANISGYITGTAQPKLSQDKLKSIEIKIPDIDTQSAIASAIGSYDDLIEINEKRIKILEEMAERLYTEWFVKFKFPGHEKVKMVDSGTEYGMIPEGWEVKKFENILKIKYGKKLPASKLLKYGKYKVYGAGGIIGFYNEKNIDHKTALITCRGNGSGVVWRAFGDGFVTNNSFIVDGINQDLGFEYIYNLLLNSNISSAISGSAQPQITVERINYVKTIIPPNNLITLFIEQARPLYNLADKLRIKNEIVSKIRDLLIPQLVTGKRELKNV